MRKFKGVYFFYQKVLIPSIAFSLLLSLFSLPFTKFNVGLGSSYIIVAPVIHYFTYDIRNPDEYYFYFNLGLSKIVLWSCTLLISSVLGFTAIIL
jgi:hypothetical protein